MADRECYSCGAKLRDHPDGRCCRKETMKTTDEKIQKSKLTGNKKTVESGGRGENGMSLTDADAPLAFMETCRRRMARRQLRISFNTSPGAKGFRRLCSAM